MADAGLSYDQAPPLGLPLRFFLAAPLFLALAAAGALLAGPDLYDSRWNPDTLAITHLLTLGFLCITMVGALLQMMPVVLGIPLPAVRAVAWASLLGISTGTLSLAAGLAWGGPVWLTLSGLLLTAGLVPFIVSMLVGVTRSRAASAVLWPMRQAWLGLLLVAVLGMWLVLGLTGRLALPDMIGLTDLHLAWGLGGWVLLLVTGVTYQVVPMLQLTPTYPAIATRWLTWIMVLGLAAWTSAALWPGLPTWLAHASLWIVAFAALVFAALTLWLLGRRRRKIGDTTLAFWRLGMICLGAAAIATPFVQGDKARVMLTVLFLLGFAVSVVSGMLYKIVPFLAWFHLQAQKPGEVMTIPNMRQYVSDKWMRRHFYLHLAGVLMILPAPWLPGLVGQAGAAVLLASGILLWSNLIRARRLFLMHGGQL